MLALYRSAGRRTRSRPTRRDAACSRTSSGSSRARSCATSRRRSCGTTSASRRRLKTSRTRNSLGAARCSPAPPSGRRPGDHGRSRGGERRTGRRRNDASSVEVPPNSVAVIDAKTNRVVEAVPRRHPARAGRRGTRFVVGRQHRRQDADRIDLKTRRVVRRRFRSERPRARIAVGARCRLDRARAARTDHPRRPAVYTTRSRAVTDSATLSPSAA